MKKRLSILLTALIIATSICVPTKSYADTYCKKIIKENKLYKYDLDGDGDRDEIEVFYSNGKMYIDVNGCIKKLCDYWNEGDFEVKLYDFNKNDKSLEIVCEWWEEALPNTRIMKFKNKICKVNKVYTDAVVKSYTPSNGMVTFNESNYGRLSCFQSSMGCYTYYPKTRINGYSFYNQYTAKFGDTKWRYRAAKKLTAYTSVGATKKAFTINKRDVVYVYALYKKGDVKRIKVKNRDGKYGYLKASSTLLFDENSCMWFR